MDESKLIGCVETLINKAAEASSAVDALQLSQAACNAANAIAVLKKLEKRSLLED